MSKDEFQEDFDPNFAPDEDRKLLGSPPGGLGDRSELNGPLSKRFVHHSKVDPIHGELREMARCAAQFPRQHPRRRRLLGRMMGLIQRSRKLTAKPEGLSQEAYDDALFEAWRYFCGNLCPPPLTAKQAYDPDGKGSPLTWLNAYLKWRLYDAKAAAQKARVEVAQPFFRDGNWLEPLERVSSPADGAIAWERLRDWVATDPDGTLAAVSVTEGRPEITAQVVLRDYLEPEWLKLREIAERYGLAPGTLNYFWTTKVKPLLVDFLENDSALFGG